MSQEPDLSIPFEDFEKLFAEIAPKQRIRLIKRFPDYSLSEDGDKILKQDGTETALREFWDMTQKDPMGKRHMYNWYYMIVANKR